MLVQNLNTGKEFLIDAGTFSKYHGKDLYDFKFVTGTEDEEKLFRQSNKQQKQRMENVLLGMTNPIAATFNVKKGATIEEL
jgi:hypothetical protein